MNTPRKTVLVLGANGRFGAAAVEAFAAAGWQVLAQARRVPASLPANAIHLSAPLDDLAALAQAARGVRCVVYAVNPAYTRWAQEVLPLARAAMDLTQALGARFMLPGNVYNFGQGMPALLVEDTPQRPTTRKGRIRTELENELESRATGELRSVVVRAGDFYGGGVGSWLDLVIVKSLHAGKLVYPGPLDLPHAWAYLPDLARAFVAVAGCDQLPRFARLHFAGHTLTGRELLALIEHAAAALGLTPAAGWRHGGVPWPLLRLGGLLVPMLREVSEMAYLWRVAHALDGTKLEATVGALPVTPPQTAMREALRALGFGDARAASGA